MSANDPAFDFRNHVILPLHLYQLMASCYYGGGPRAHSPSDEDLNSFPIPPLSPPVNSVLETIDELEEARSVGLEGSPAPTEQEEAIIRSPFDVPGYTPQGLNALPKRKKNS